MSDLYSTHCKAYRPVLKFFERLIKIIILFLIALEKLKDLLNLKQGLFQRVQAQGLGTQPQEDQVKKASRRNHSKFSKTKFQLFKR